MPDYSPSPPPPPPEGSFSPQPAAPPPPAPNPAPGASFGSNIDGKQWALFLHLSQLINFVIPLGGIVAPILIWQLKKPEFPGLDAHGKMVTNWMISAFIYGIAGTLLNMLFCIGLIILIPLAIAAIVFPILGGLKAKDGIFWKYPLTIEFLK